MKLYWAVTAEGFENWFVIARSHIEAERFHAFAEGFDPVQVRVKKIIDIPRNLIEKHSINEECWPSHELIRDLGGKLSSEDNPRIVNFNGKIYQEGLFQRLCSLIK